MYINSRAPFESIYIPFLSSQQPDHFYHFELFFSGTFLPFDVVKTIQDFVRPFHQLSNDVNLNFLSLSLHSTFYMPYSTSLVFVSFFILINLMKVSVNKNVGIFISVKAICSKFINSARYCVDQIFLRCNYAHLAVILHK